MGRGRKPLPTAVKERSGAFIKHPERRNHEEPKVKHGAPPIPDAVARDSVAKACWERTCATMNELGTLATADGDVIGDYCMLTAQYLWLWEVVREGNVVDINGKGARCQSPESQQFLKVQAARAKLMTELGLTPSARSRMKAAPSDKDDPFLEWLSKDSTN